MNNIPVIALKSKVKENRFLAAGLDAGDWSDPELDVTLKDIRNAYLIWRLDFTRPTDEDLEEHKEMSRKHKQFMQEKFGDDAIVSFDVDEWLKYYKPVHLEISQEEFEHVKGIAGL